MTSTSPAMAVAMLSSENSPEKLAPERRTRTSLQRRLLGDDLLVALEDRLLVVVGDGEQRHDLRGARGCSSRRGWPRSATMTFCTSAIDDSDASS